MAELVDAPDLKSVAHCERAGSSPAVGTFNMIELREFTVSGATVPKDKKRIYPSGLTSKLARGRPFSGRERAN